MLEKPKKAVGCNIHPLVLNSSNAEFGVVGKKVKIHQGTKDKTKNLPDQNFIVEYNPNTTHFSRFSLIDLQFSQI